MTFLPKSVHTTLQQKQTAGDKPWGCGHWDNKYEIDTRERNMGSSHYGKLEYYHTSMWDKGGVWTHSKTVPSVYYHI